MPLLSRLWGLAPYLAGASLLIALAVLALRQGAVLTETVAVKTALPSPGVEGPEGGVARTQTREFEIVTLLPKDGIPALFWPELITVEAANRQLDGDDLVIGVSINGEHRAYGVAFLSGHEIVDDVVGGRPIAVTW